ncbi:unnamed protein product [Allacma fusca]|uniref:NADP-dependent oxidoreductase domain-containing protein n=1 Tax=Allacma fusca TaxID=39272 RepID=A0A8J2JQR1_9HEXA|nr:unnamed protein product [Allacma fusca]
MTSVKFFNGYSMPLVGLGTWQSSDPTELEKALDAALEAGYRHIDTAYMYENEAVIGGVLKRWLDSGKIKREELFVVTKLPPIGMRPEHVPHFIQLSLKSLQLDYLDLYLVHMPVGFNRPQIDRIMKVSKIQPANHQIELHAYFQRPALVEACKKHNITIVAYAPIGSPGRKQLYAARGITFTPIGIMEDPVVVEIAKNHSKTPAQVLMRLLVQQEIAVIPKSVNPERLRQNFDLFSFELTPTELEKLKALDQGPDGRTFSMNLLGPALKEHPEGKYVFID